MNLYIIGGGTAGWMTAATFVKAFPKSNIVVVESPNVPSVGVGESTTQYFRLWTHYLGLRDEDWMRECDATYKISVRFSNFHKDGDTPWQYPFGTARSDAPEADVWFWNAHKNGWKHDKFARDYFVAAECAERALLPINAPGFSLKHNTGFHFDAVKFANYLRDHYCKDKVTHIRADVNGVIYDNDFNVKSFMADGVRYDNGDLYVDCTGFKGLVTRSEWIDYSDWLPNNSAWVTRMDYNDRETEMVPFTQCTALSSGWVWRVPTWNRIGTGYVYSDKYISDEDALKEFIQHAGADEDANFRKLKFNVGRREEVWHNNVLSIGLSAGFIEPLESNGLLSVHEFLLRFVRTVDGRSTFTQFMRDTFNKAVNFAFDGFASFVALHYSMTQRDDTRYWRAVSNIKYPQKGMLESASILLQEESTNFASKLNFGNGYTGDSLMCVMAGHGWNPFNHVIEDEILFYGPIPEDSHLNSWHWNYEQWDLDRYCEVPYRYYLRTLYAN